LTAGAALVYWQRMRSEPPDRRSRPPLRGVLPALALAALACITGCITVDGTLLADGSGTLTLSYVAPPGSTEASQRELLKAPGITIKSATLDADRKFSASLDVADLAAITKTTVFRNVTVTTTAQGDDQVLTIKVVHEPKVLRDKTLPGPKVGITLPGKVAEANENGVVDGAHVEWTIPLADFLSRPAWELTARYRPAKPGEADAQGAKPAQAPSGESKPEAGAK
jgi:hypothetical protein